MPVVMMSILQAEAVMRNITRRVETAAMAQDLTLEACRVDSLAI
jgi:hypothetical protein